MPVDLVSGLSQVITGWARMPGPHFREAYTGWAWLGTWSDTWLSKHPFLHSTPWTFATVAIVGIAAVALDRWTGKPPVADEERRPVTLAIAFAVLTSLIGLAFWFLKAPDPRFGIGFLLGTPSLVIAGAIWRLSRDRGIARLACAGHAVTVIVLLLSAAFLRSHWAVASQMSASWPVIPAVPALEDRALGEFHANMPVDSRQCWDAPLPCTTEYLGRPLREGRVFVWRTIEAGAKPSRP
jgi:hypothetical protein